MSDLPEIGPAPEHLTFAADALWHVLAPHCDRVHPCSLILLEAAVNALLQARRLVGLPHHLRFPAWPEAMGEAYEALTALGCSREVKADAIQYADGIQPWIP